MSKQVVAAAGRHLWQGCKRLLAQLDNGSEASLRLQQVHSLASLEQQHGPYDAVVVAAGAAVGTLPEVGTPTQPQTAGKACHHCTSDTASSAPLAGNAACRAAGH